MFIEDFIVIERLGEMEGGVRRNGAQVSPERCIVWTEPSRKLCMQRQQGTKVPVVYYLCKSSLLEHPHFIEVPFSSPEGLYLRDVISRLVVLRGKHMPTMYSWSCKRSYRNGFVWQDLAEDDIIIPAQGNDYILKGSLLLNEGSAGATQQHRTCLHGSASHLVTGVLTRVGFRFHEQNLYDGFCVSKSNNNLENLAHQQNKHSLYSRNEEASTLSSMTTMREVKPLSPTRLPSPHPLVNEKSLPSHQSSTTVINSSNSGECKVLKPSGALDASTKTEHGGEKKEYEPSSQTTCVSSENGMPVMNFNEIQPNDVQANDGLKEEKPQILMPPNGRTGTLMSLIQAEVEKLDRFKVAKEEGLYQSKVKIKRTNALLQLISCGSILKKVNIS